MSNTRSLNLYSRLCKFLFACLFAGFIAALLPACGGGGGGSDDVDQQPAPQTLNAIRLTLFPGFDIIFIRDSGDVLTGGVETGTIVVTEAVEASPEGAVRDASTLVDTTVDPAERIFLATYTYDRTGRDSGVITVTGSSTNDGDYMNDAFDRTYNMIFATDGVVITSVIVNDWGEAIANPGLLWTNPILSLYGGGSVPVGYSITLSEGQELPYLFPRLGLSGLIFQITPDPLSVISTDELEYNFVTSVTSASVITTQGTVNTVNSGTGTGRNVTTFSALEAIGYNYEPDPLTIDEAVVVTNGAVIETVLNNTYNLTFGDFRSGTYVDSNGEIGEFLFPDLLLGGP